MFHLLFMTAAATSKPNIVVILTDDLGWNTAYNNADIISPHINALASNGVRLTSHYVYRYCSPTRAALLTGRSPLALANCRENFIPITLPQGTDVGFTMLPARLAEAGYVSHQIGKWHQGFHTPAFLPVGRGFNTSYGFLAGGEDHYTQETTKCDWGKVTDYWDTHAPAADCSVPPPDRQPCPQWTVEQKRSSTGAANGMCASASYTNCAWDAAAAQCFQCKPKRYTGFDFAAKAVELIAAHDAAAAPMFMYLALHNTHGPIEAPPEFESLYSFPLKHQNVFDGMVSVVDSTVGNVTAALKANGMWDNTLLIWTTDNGSPVQVAGSNAPLKGGKGSIWEGGVRVPAAINGGFLPASARGTTLDGLVTIWDYYATFLTLAGVANPTGDPDNDRGSPAKPDSHDMWPYWSGAAPASPRAEAVLDHLMYDKNFTACVYAGRVQSVPCSGSGAIRAGDLKLIVGEIGFAEWYGHFSPNASWTKNMSNYYGCSAASPCLYNVTEDMNETNDLSAARPDDLAKMLVRYHAHDAEWHPPSDPPKDEQDLYCQVALQNGGFATPWHNSSSSA